MVVDTVLAMLHHLLVFMLAAVIAGEFVLVRRGLAGRDLRILGHIDGAYGGIAIMVVVVGVCRVLFGLKGWEFYVYNHSFWGKMIAFVIVGLLSVPPTMRILKWRKAAKAAPDVYVAPDREVDAVRRYLRFEALVFAFILIFAAMMARGIGY